MTDYPRRKTRGETLNVFFVNGKDIHDEVLKRNIAKFLGPEASFRRSKYNLHINPAPKGGKFVETKQGILGYTITALRPFTSTMLDELIWQSRAYVSDRMVPNQEYSKITSSAYKQERQHDPDHYEFDRQIYIFPPDGQRFKPRGETKSLRLVLFDTQCTQGNWISISLPNNLGMTDEIQRVGHHPDIQDFQQRSLEATGEISFRWQLHGGITIHDPVLFYVFDIPNDIEMIFGSQYIKMKKLVTVNLARMLPLTSHTKKTSTETSEMSDMERNQQEGAARVDAYRESFDRHLSTSSPSSNAYSRHTRETYSAMHPPGESSSGYMPDGPYHNKNQGHDPYGYLSQMQGSNANSAGYQEQPRDYSTAGSMTQPHGYGSGYPTQSNCSSQVPREGYGALSPNQDSARDTQDISGGYFYPDKRDRSYPPPINQRARSQPDDRDDPRADARRSRR